MSRLELMAALFSRSDSPFNIIENDGIVGHVLSVSKEDGSANSFNVKVRVTKIEDGYVYRNSNGTFMRTGDITEIYIKTVD